MIRTGADVTRIVGRELLAPIGTGTSAIRSYYSFNPSLSSAYPWLSNIVKCYSKFRVRSLKFIFQSNIPTTVGGSMAFGWFADHPDAASWAAGGHNVGQLLMSYKSGIQPLFQSGQFLTMSSSEIHANVPWFAVNSAISAFTTPGALGIAIDFGATQATATFPGNFFVEYDIELTQPVAPALGPNALRADDDPVPPGCVDDGCAPFGPPRPTSSS